LFWISFNFGAKHAVFEQQTVLDVELAILFVEHNKDLRRVGMVSAQGSRKQWLSELSSSI